MKVGDLYPVWWATGKRDEQGRPLARIIEIQPYTGRYPHWFTHTLRLHAPETRKGWLEMSIDVNDQISTPFTQAPEAA